MHVQRPLGPGSKLVRAWARVPDQGYLADQPHDSQGGPACQGMSKYLPES